MHWYRTAATLIVLVGFAWPACGAGPAMGVEVGWGNAYRAGRWNPIYITAKSSPPREVIAHIEGMHDAPHAMAIASRFALSPTDTTHAVYFPLGESYELPGTTLVLRDAESGKRLASMKLALNPPLEQAPLDRLMIGVSGEPSTSDLLRGQLAEMATVGYVTQPYLPFVAAGYDALDVLILSAPDLARIDEGQQAAILAWVRAGGTLLMWPGATATPPGSLLAAALPAVIGENRLVAIDPGAGTGAGLARVEKIWTRELSPIEASQRIDLLGPDVAAYRRSIGFGQFVIVPIDLATLRFTSNLAIPKFWSPLLQGVPDRGRDDVPHMKLTRWLRDTPAHRTRTVPVWLIGVLLIVGPVDSLLLKLLGRRPWTVMTALGWTGLIAAVALNAREGSRPRPIEYRTVRVIDEADGVAAMVTDYTAVRWTAGTTLAFPREPNQWWEPAADPTDPPDGPRSELRAEQNESGTWPAPMAAHVPTPRVLQARKWTTDASLIKADLVRRGGRVSGKLTNQSERPLRNLRLRFADGVATLPVPTIEPGATADVDAAIEPNDGSLALPPIEQRFTERRATDTPVLTPDYAAIESSTFRRSSRIAELLARGGSVCVYAEVVEPVPPAELPDPLRQQHMAFLRSVVRSD